MGAVIKLCRLLLVVVLSEMRGGRWLQGFSSFEGQGDVHMAELLGIVRGLQLAWQKGYGRVICESDCLNAVQSIVSQKTVNLHSCATLLTEIRCLLQDEWEEVVQHVPREKFKVANVLAKLGLSVQWTLTTWDRPPAEIPHLRESC